MLSSRRQGWGAVPVAPHTGATRHCKSTRRVRSVSTAGVPTYGGGAGRLNRRIPGLPGVSVPAPTRVVVDVMLKPEILDPQGQAIANALPSLGFSSIASVRQGKRFEVELSGEATEEALEEVRRAASTLLANPVIEDYEVRVEVIQ
ncbi:phosphoribosylformylglycinamidine synthase subunit PurS [Cryptosporangium phraense]|uniref:Phosphoribosylformylglycinamidine synthase subunit PurS n=1 Tax=Cryptosporangium phraense TaxID=2593070 RepID=A0A545AMG7_9ACTN|nr:phosphoribosylformylglycinamidine synthase subunit PurS [Cryptosporangium phraense]